MESENYISEQAKQLGYERFVPCGAMSLVFPEAQDIVRSIELQDGDVSSLANISPDSDQLLHFHAVNLEAIKSSERKETDIYGLVSFTMPPYAPKASPAMLARNLLTHLESQLLYSEYDIAYDGDTLVLDDGVSAVEIKCFFGDDAAAHVSLHSAVDTELDTDYINESVQAVAVAWAHAYDFALRLRIQHRSLGGNDFTLVPIGQANGSEVHDIELILATELAAQRTDTPDAKLPEFAEHFDTRKLNTALELQRLSHDDKVRIAQSIVSFKRGQHEASGEPIQPIDHFDIIGAVRLHTDKGEVV